MKMDTSYLPVQYYYIEAIQEAIQKERNGKVFFFNDKNEVDSAEGKVTQLRELDGQGFFLFLNPDAVIRIDRIITLFGKPGAAYDEYDAYSNQCLSCTGGYDIDSLP
jgi:hypothetical protein